MEWNGILMYGVRSYGAPQSEKIDGIRKKVIEARVLKYSQQYKKQNTGEKSAQNQHMIKTDDKVTENSRWGAWLSLHGRGINKGTLRHAETCSMCTRGR